MSAPFGPARPPVLGGIARIVVDLRAELEHAIHETGPIANASEAYARVRQAVDRFWLEARASGPIEQRVYQKLIRSGAMVLRAGRDLYGVDLAASAAEEARLCDVQSRPPLRVANLHDAFGRLDCLAGNLREHIFDHIDGHDQGGFSEILHEFLVEIIRIAVDLRLADLETETMIRHDDPSVQTFVMHGGRQVGKTAALDIINEARNAIAERDAALNKLRRVELELADLRRQTETREV
jgi:glycosyltransferase involved in cell wall biosynthesis